MPEANEAVNLCTLCHLFDIQEVGTRQDMVLPAAFQGLTRTLPCICHSLEGMSKCLVELGPKLYYSSPFIQTLPLRGMRTGMWSEPE